MLIVKEVILRGGYMLNVNGCGEWSEEMLKSLNLYLVIKLIFANGINRHLSSAIWVEVIIMRMQSDVFQICIKW